ncbi:hypothetical protein [Paenisporosarcina indica]|nr:hypothetical protein [Paenisporosarcina indica]
MSRNLCERVETEFEGVESDDEQVEEPRERVEIKMNGDKTNRHISLTEA